MKANIKITGGNKEDVIICRYAADLALEAFNCSVFDEMVLSHEYDGKKCFSSCQLSNEEVLAVIKSASEYLTPENDGEIDLEWRLYYKRFSSAIGWTSPKIIHINSNVKKLRVMDIPEIAGHMAHEWTHKLGFEHDYKATKRRPFSAPYAIGDIIEKIAREIR